MQLRDLPKNQPAPQIPPSFIKELRRRFGENPFGQPNICLEWGQTPNKLVDGILRHKAEYLATRAKVKLGVVPEAPGSLLLKPVYQWIDIGIPRFFACDWWPAARLGPEHYDKEMFGDFPGMGEYRSFLRLDDPDTGEYLQPGRRMLELIEEVWCIRDRMRQLHTFEENDNVVQERAALQAKLDHYNANWDAFWKKQEDALYQEIRPHVHRLLTSTPNKGQIKRR